MSFKAQSFPLPIFVILWYFPLKRGAALLGLKAFRPVMFYFNWNLKPFLNLVLRCGIVSKSSYLLLSTVSCVEGECLTAIGRFFLRKSLFVILSWKMNIWNAWHVRIDLAPSQHYNCAEWNWETKKVHKGYLSNFWSEVQCFRATPSNMCGESWYWYIGLSC